MVFLILLGLALGAPLYWALPERWRPDALLAGSALGLALIDPRLLLLLAAVNALLWTATRLRPSRGATWFSACGLAALLALFVWNKLASPEPWSPTAKTTTGLVLLGVSYLVLKASSVLIESARGNLRAVTLRQLLLWTTFLPIYPAGPIEAFEHFRRQSPRYDAQIVLRGLDRILLGLVRVLLVAIHLRDWAQPIILDPAGHNLLERWGALYAFTVAVYMDFAGYSDLAIGAAALYGYQIQENFDKPLLRRNLVKFWQGFHMTLTHWLRTYLFIPISRAILRRSRRLDVVALVFAQVVTMTVCGLWHGLQWSFVVWGVLQAAGMLWVTLPARAIGRRLPAPWLDWWRHHWSGAVLSWWITVTYYSASAAFGAGGVLGGGAGVGWSFLVSLLRAG